LQNPPKNLPRSLELGVVDQKKYATQMELESKEKRSQNHNGASPIPPNTLNESKQQSSTQNKIAKSENAKSILKKEKDQSIKRLEFPIGDFLTLIMQKNLLG
jgi:hypothetical protein